MAFEEVRYGILGGLWPSWTIGGDQPDSTEELPEPLVEATIHAAVCIGRDGMPPSTVLPKRAAWLVRKTLRAMAREGW
jgi:hypothetical protein